MVRSIGPALGVALLAMAGCSWFQHDEPKQKVVVPTTPRVTNFPTEAEATIACGRDVVVWGDSTALVYYLAGGSLYGKTTHGGYMCKEIAVHGGYKPAPVAAK